MPEDQALVWIGGIAALGICGVLWAFYSQWRTDADRARAFSEFAGRKGFLYDEKAPETRKKLGLPFGWGSHSQRNFIRGEIEGVPFILFDFLISTKNNRLLRTWVAFELPPEFPKFRVIPNTLAYLLDRSLTWERVHFPQDPPFGEAYRVEAPDSMRAGVVFSDDVRGALSQRLGWAVESRGGWLQLTDHQLDKPAETLEGFLHAGWDVARPFLGR